MRILRVAILALGLVLGTVLILHGATLIGALVVASVALRTAMFVKVTRARSSAGNRFGSPGGDGRSLAVGRRGQRSSAAGPAFERLTPGGIEAAARTIGMSGADLRAQLADGQSIADLASARGITPDQVVQAVVADASARIDQAVAAGRLPSRRAAWARSNLPGWANGLVHGDPAPVG
jgi:hypothetical protein